MSGKYPWVSIICLLGGLPVGAWLAPPKQGDFQGDTQVVVQDVVPLNEPQVQERPSLEAVLSADRRAQFRLIARFLPQATLEEIQALLEIPLPDPSNLTGPETDSWCLLLDRWCALAPQECLAWVRDTIDLRRLEGWCFYAWSLRDPMGALEESEKPPQDHLSQVVDGLVKHSISDALALSDRYPDNHSLRYSVLSVWAKTDPEAALGYLRSLPEKQQGSIMDTLLGKIASDDSEKALSLVLDMVDADERARALSIILPRVIEDDPDKAEKLIRDMPEAKPRFDFMCSLAKERAKRDPKAAMAWAKNQADQGVRRAALAAAFDATSFETGADRVAALKEVGLEEALPNSRQVVSTLGQYSGGAWYHHGGDLGGHLTRTVDELAKADPEMALQLIAEIPPKIGQSHNGFHPKGELLRALGKSWVQGAHRESFVETFLKLPSDRDRAYFIESGVNDASLETIDWLASHPELFEYKGRILMDSLTSRWVEVDSLGASEWIESMSDSPVKDRAIGHLVHSLVEGRRPDLETAFAWAQVVNDFSQRGKAMRMVYRHWKASDPDAAQQVLSDERVRNDLIGVRRSEP